ncbi:hypothetical protein [Flavobacterium sp.]
MKKINQNSLLDQKILALTNKRDYELMDLKNQFNVLLDSAKPMNLIKQSISGIAETPGTKESILELGTSFLGGYLSKRLLFGKSNSIVKNLIGNALQYSISTLINKYNEIKHERNS